jgi:DNA polymerase-1
MPSILQDLQADIKKLSEYLFIKKERAEKKYHTIENNTDGENLFLQYRQKALMVGISSVDIETTGLNMFDPETEIFSIAFCSEDHESYFMLWETVLKNSYIKKLVWDILENKDIAKWGQNFKFDIKFLYKKAGIKVKGYKADSMLFHYLINEQHNTHNLDSLSWEYTDDGGYKDATVDKIKDVKAMTIEDLKDRNCNDTDCVFQIVPKLTEEIKKQGLTYLSQYTIALERTLCEIETDGVKLDVPLINKTLTELNKKIRIVGHKLIDFAEKHGVTKINLNSQQQIANLVFKKLKFKPKYFTKKLKSPAVNKDYLNELAPEYNWARYLLMYRTYNKIATTYLQSWLDKVDADGILHCSFYVDGTETGRLSSRAPNMQNLPKPKEEDEEVPVDAQMYNLVKQCVISRFGDEGAIIEFDFSQLELRIIAIVTKDKNFCEACCAGIDLHQRTAQLMFKDDTITKDDPRRNASKAINFLLVYGGGVKKLAAKLKVSEEEAQQNIDSYFKTFSDYEKWTRQEKINLVKRRKAVSLLGRIRRLPNIVSTKDEIKSRCMRQGINAEIQGLGGDMTNHALIEINKEFRKRQLKSKLILTVHDSILSDTYLPEKEEVIKIMKECMERKRWDWQIVPLEVDGKIGKNWAEMEKIK